jgi:hypothetical protein
VKRKQTKAEGVKQKQKERNESKRIETKAKGVKRKQTKAKGVKRKQMERNVSKSSETKANESRISRTRMKVAISTGVLRPRSSAISIACGFMVTGG